MRCLVRYPPAATEVANAIRRYDQPDINQAASLVREIERTEAYLALRPKLNERVEGEIRRAALRRFPYSLSYVIENNFVIVLPCMHQHQSPRSRDDLLRSQ